MSTNIDTIKNEKETQYTTMKAVCKIMDDMGDAGTEQMNEEMMRKKREREMLEALMADKQQMS